MGYFKWGNPSGNVLDSSLYGVFIDQSQIFAKPEKDVTFVSVPGRNGDLSFSNGRYKNIEISVNCYIPTNFIDKFARFINTLSNPYMFPGYQKLFLSGDPEVYREAQFVSATEPHTGANNEFAEFELIFNCKPQKYYDWENSEGATTVDPNGTSFDNPSVMESFPWFELEGNGTLSIYEDVSVLTMTISVSNVPNDNLGKYTVIDCESQDAYNPYDFSNRNPNLTVTYDRYGYVFPRFGGNYWTDKVKYTGFDSVLCHPRFWRL